MKKTFEELIERANTIKAWLSVDHYELYHYEDGSFADIKVSNVNDISHLVALAGSCMLRMYSDNNVLVIRIYER